jgi:hypothetical protein
MRLGVLVCLAANLGWAADYSLVVLNHSTYYSLVRVSPDGQYLATIANGFLGHGLAKDSSGNYLIATGKALLRVTPSGSVTTVAMAPAGSQWLKVTAGPDNSGIVGDNRQHALWSVSADGRTVAKIANYPVPRYNELEDIGVASDGRGDYLVFEDNQHAGRLYRITPRGEVTDVPLSSPLNNSPTLVADGPGAYLAQNGRGDSIVRITSAGEVTHLADFVPGHVYITGLARDPATHEILATVTHENAILRIGADGKNASTLTNSPTFIKDPMEILVETGQ